MIEVVENAEVIEEVSETKVKKEGLIKKIIFGALGMAAAGAVVGLALKGSKYEDFEDFEEIPEDDSNNSEDKKSEQNEVSKEEEA